MTSASILYAAMKKLLHGLAKTQLNIINGILLSISVIMN